MRVVVLGAAHAHVRRMRRVERIADAIFVTALLLMVAVCMFITYALSVAPPV